MDVFPSGMNFKLISGNVAVNVIMPLLSVAPIGNRKSLRTSAVRSIVNHGATKQKLMPLTVCTFDVSSSCVFVIRTGEHLLIGRALVRAGPPTWLANHQPEQ